MEDGGGFALVCDGKFNREFFSCEKKKFNREAPFVWDAVLLQDFGDRCEIPFLCHGRVDGELAIRNLGGKAWILML